MMKVYAALFACWLGILTLANPAAAAATLNGTQRTATGLQFTVNTDSHTNYVIERSADLQQWRPVLTNRNAATTATVSVPMVDASGYYRVRAARPFMHALAANGFIDLRGRRMLTFSYNSTNARVWPGDRGDVAAILGLTNSLEVGNAKIYGHLWTGVGGSAMIGPPGIVGSIVWHLNVGRGIEPGWHAEYTDPVFAPVVLADFGGAYPPPGNVGGTNYQYVLGSSNYAMASLTLSRKMLVTGHATLYVSHELDISGSIVIAPTGSLRLYVGAPDVSLAADTVVNQTGYPHAFQYYGLSGNRVLTLLGNGVFTGTIHAPNADLRLFGGDSAVDFIGAIVARSVSMLGDFNFH
jgi:hypothetical protein